MNWFLLLLCYIVSLIVTMLLFRVVARFIIRHEEKRIDKKLSDNYIKNKLRKY